MLQSLGTPGVPIMIVQDCPTESDLRFNLPFQGYDGKEMDKMLEEAGIDLTQVFKTSLIRVRVPGCDASQCLEKSAKKTSGAHTPLHDMWVTKELKDGYDFLVREIGLVRPRVICTVGPVATWAVTGKWGLRAWRGSQIAGIGPFADWQCVATYGGSHVRKVWADRQIIVNDLRRAGRLGGVLQGETGGGYDAQSPTDYATRAIVCPTVERVLQTLDMLESEIVPSGIPMSVDIETRQGHIDCLGIAWSEQDAISIPFTYGNVAVSFWDEETEAVILYRLYKLLTNPAVKVIGQNFLYDAQYILRWFHFIPNFARDTMLAHHTMFPSMQKSLDFQASIYLDNYRYWKKQHGSDQERWLYNCKDCCITWAIDQIQQPAIDQINMREVHDFQQSLFWPVLETMARGIRVDQTRRAQLAEELWQAIREREAAITHMVGQPLNVKSPKQMPDLFYNQLGQKPVISRKTGNPTCDEDALQTIAQREPLLRPLIDTIRELRSLGVYLSTFIQAPVDTDKRMRCSFNIAGTETFRFSSSQNAFGSGMNLQNIPKGDE